MRDKSLLVKKFVSVVPCQGNKRRPDADINFNFASLFQYGLLSNWEAAIWNLGIIKRPFLPIAELLDKVASFLEIRESQEKWKKLE